MKKLWDILVLTLALNFVAALGFVLWLHQDGRLDGERIAEIQRVLWPDEQEAAPAPEPEVEPPRPGPLEELLARHAGAPAAEQVRVIQQSFDAQTAVLDRRERDLLNLQQQVDQAQRRLAQDRNALTAEREALKREREALAQQAQDRGFQDSLDRYTVMPSRQTKDIFMTLDQRTVMSYLQAMPPRTAGRIIREFKTPEELDRIQEVLEMMRVSQVE